MRTPAAWRSWSSVISGKIGRLRTRSHARSACGNPCRVRQSTRTPRGGAQVRVVDPVPTPRARAARDGVAVVHPAANSGSRLSAASSAGSSDSAPDDALGRGAQVRGVARFHASSRASLIRRPRPGTVHPVVEPDARGGSAGLAVVSQSPGESGDFRVVRRQRAAFAVRAEVLAGIEAEQRREPEGAYAAPAIAGTWAWHASSITAIRAGGPLRGSRRARRAGRRGAPGRSRAYAR